MLKPISMEHSVTVASSQDPAVDWDTIVADELKGDPTLTEESARRQFLTTYFEAVSADPGASVGLLPVRDGETLTTFVIGAIPSAEAVRIADECKGANTLRWRAFLAGVRAVHGWDGEEVPTRIVAGVEYVRADWLARTFVRGLRDVALEIGQLVWAFNQLTEDDEKN